MAQALLKAAKGVFVGSGSDGLNEPEVCNTIMELTGKTEPKKIIVLYVGTATYDASPPKERQTQRFAEAGATIVELPVSNGLDKITAAEMKERVATADVIVVSGGNTLFAMDTWIALGLHALFREAALRGAVLCGGSAGAICWFDAGHSDSADPQYFRTKTEEGATTWEYVRVGCLGFLPGLVCPHYDKVQTNGILRATDFDQMMKRHSGERGICIDHWAALVVCKGEYKVLSVTGKTGSNAKGTFEPGQGVPCVWQTDVREGEVVRSLVSPAGRLSDLVLPASVLLVDPRLDTIRNKNPCLVSTS